MSDLLNDVNICRAVFFFSLYFSKETRYNIMHYVFIIEEDIYS